MNRLRQDIVRIAFAVLVLAGMVLVSPGSAVAEPTPRSVPESYCAISVEGCDAQDVSIQPHLISAAGATSSWQLLRVGPALLGTCLEVRARVVESPAMPVPVATSVAVHLRAHAPACPLGP